MEKRSHFAITTLLVGTAHLVLALFLIAGSRSCSRPTIAGGAPASAEVEQEDVVWMDPEVFASAILPDQAEKVPTPLPEDDPPSDLLLPTPSSTPTPPPTPSPTRSPSATPKPKVSPTASPSPRPSKSPTKTPIKTPSVSPKKSATKKPSARKSPAKSATTKAKPSKSATAKKSATKSDPNADKKEAFLKSKPGASGSGTGGSGGRSGGGVGADGPDLSGYHGQIRRRFFDRWEQPRSVFVATRHPVATVTIRIEKNGRISGVSLVKSSGDLEMDASVMRAAESVSAIDPHPPGLNLSVYEVDIDFELQ